MEARSINFESKGNARVFRGGLAPKIINNFNKWAPPPEPPRNYPCTILDSSCAAFLTESDIKISHAHMASDSADVVHITPLMGGSLNWPTVVDMIKVETACMVYKSINDLAPDYLSEMFAKNSAYSRKNLRNTATDLQVPLMKTCNGQRAFSYRGAGVWNHLDLEVKQASSFKAFKDAVKR